MGGNLVIKEIRADKIPIFEIGRITFINKIKDLLNFLNNEFFKLYGFKIWKDISDIFNGSSRIIMDLNILEIEISPFKKTIGDIDIMIPKEYKEKFWNLLNLFEEKEIILNIIYKGNNKKTKYSIGEQINSLFIIKFNKTFNCQLDFEFTDFKNNKPNEFSRFGHSSELIDIQKDFKGVLHKYLMRAITGSIKIKKDIYVITDKSSFEKPRFKKLKGEFINEIRLYKFSVTKGIRFAYKKEYIPNTNILWKKDGKQVYREIKEIYITDLNEISKLLFGKEVKQEMWSFIGLIKLILKYISKEKQEIIKERFIDLCFGENSQKLERNNNKLDFLIKQNGIRYLNNKLFKN